MFKTEQRKAYTHWFKLFSLINLIVFYLTAIIYLRHLPMINDHYSSFFVVFTYFGQIGFVYLLTMIPASLLLLIYPRFFSVVVVATVFAIFAQLLLFIDTFVFSTFTFHLNLILIKVIFSTNMVEFFGLNTLETVMAYSLVLIISVLEIALAWLIWKKGKYFKFKIFFSAIVILILFCEMISQTLYAYAYALGKENTIQNSRAFPMYMGTTANTFLVKHNILSKYEIVHHNNVEKQLSGNHLLHYPLHPIRAQHIKNPPNIIIIGIDAWRFDTMTKAIVPHIYQFSKKTSRFDDHFSGGNCTLAGLYTLYYSIPSLYWKATTVPPVLFDEFAKYHYREGVFFSAGMIYPPFYKNIFLSVKGLKITTPGAKPYIRDANITEEGLTFLNKYKTDKRPFFLFFFYDAAHSYSLSPTFRKPFQPIREMDHAELNNSTNPVPYFNVYKNALYYDDYLINKLLVKLKKLHLYKNTIIIITTDHGEEFNDNHKDYWGHTSNFTKYQTKIPLMIYWPGRKIQQIHYKTSHYDIVPTLLQDVFKVRNPISDYSIGHNLFSGKANWHVLPVGSYSFQGLIAPPYIYRFYPMGVTAVYNMKADLQKTFPANAKALRIYLQDASRYYK